MRRRKKEQWGEGDCETERKQRGKNPISALGGQERRVGVVQELKQGLNYELVE